MSLIEQFAQKPPARTTIFNLNNGEEDSLCGSHAYGICAVDYGE